MRISELARRSGATANAVRYYLELGHQPLASRDARSHRVGVVPDVCGCCRGVLVRRQARASAEGGAPSIRCVSSVVSGGTGSGEACSLSGRRPSRKIHK